MHESPQDVFELRNSGLEAFLHAELGMEPNGSMLTVLSMLARLGRDPWQEAGRWARLPKSAVIDSLVHIMAEMPLHACVPTDPRATAARLVLLLPSSAPAFGLTAKGWIGLMAAPGAVPLTILLGALLLGAVMNLLAFQAPPDGPAAHARQTMQFEP